MNKLEKPIKGKNIKYLLDAFFNKYIRKHFNEVNSIDFIISDLGEQMNDGGRNIKILRNDNPIRTNNPDWFPPKAQQTDHICTFLKQLMDNELGTKDSYVGLKVEVVTETETYAWDVRAVDYYENSGTVILKTDPRQGVSIQCPAIVRLYIYPLLTSKAVSSIIYNSIVTSNSKYNFILGERNIHKGKDNVWILGKNNVSRENNQNSLIDGYNNDVDSYGNLVIGDNNMHRSYYGATVGQRNKNFKKNSFLFGEGHDNGNGSQYGTAFGKYSNIDSKTAFAIGDGTNENNRHNLFEIKSDGRILDKYGNDIREGKTQVQADWNETHSGLPSFIKNKPSILSYYNVVNTSINYKVGDLISFNNARPLNSNGLFSRIDCFYGIINSVSQSTLTIRGGICRFISPLLGFEPFCMMCDFTINRNNREIDVKSITNKEKLTMQWLTISYALRGNFNRNTSNMHIFKHMLNLLLSIDHNYVDPLGIPYGYDDSADKYNVLNFLQGKVPFNFYTTTLDDFNNTLFNKNDGSYIYILRGNKIQGIVTNYTYKAGDSNITYNVLFKGLVPITTDFASSDIIRWSNVKFELTLVLDVRTYNIVSEIYSNIEEI